MTDSKVPVTQQKAVPSNGIFDMTTAFRSELDRLFERVSQSFGFTVPTQRPSAASSLVTPAVDVVEKDGALMVTAELPGLTKEDVIVQVSDRTLMIKGTKDEHREQSDANYYISERSYGSFVRTFPLPDNIDQSAIAADFSKGVLTITLPKIAGAAPKTIPVKAAA